MKINASEIRVGMLLEYKNDLWQVLKTQHVKPGKGGAFAQVEMKSVGKNTKLNERFRSSETVEKASLDENKYNYMYEDDANYFFMEPKTFEQIEIKKEIIGEQGKLLTENLEVSVSFYNENPISVELPNQVQCKIETTDAALKGQTVSSSYKPATLDNGLNIQVPPFIEAGDEVIVIGYDLGMNTNGGFAQYTKVPSHWILPLPKNLSMKESMIFGTAGFTAGYAVHMLQMQGVLPSEGPVVVSGASGGVGSISLTILADLGYEVHGSSGKTEATKFLMKLGASSIINRESLLDEYNRSLLKEMWAGAVDTVGGATLDGLLKNCMKRGTVIVIGNIKSQKLNTSILPFILRGIKLIGINSQYISKEYKEELWSKLANEWKPKNLNMLAKECVLEDLNLEIDKMLSGNLIGRVIVNLK